MGSGLWQEFGVRIDVHQGSVLSTLIFATVADVVMEDAREGLLNEILSADVRKFRGFEGVGYKRGGTELIYYYSMSSTQQRNRNN